MKTILIPACDKLPDYHIGKYPVTNEQFQQFIDDTGYDKELPVEKGNHPVVNVSWFECLIYCQWLSVQEDKLYRLPTEAEWYKAASGQDKFVYPWGNEWDKAKCNTYESGMRDTTPVNAYPEGLSPYGVYDMIGNVWEWTAGRVLRGGAWFFISSYARCSGRRRFRPYDRGSLIGFRLVTS